MSDNTTSKESSKKSNKGVIIISIVAIIIIAVMGAVIWHLVNGEEKVSRPGVGKGTIATPDNIEEIMEAEKTPVGSYTTEMNSNWNFKSSSEPSENAFVKNNERNTNTVYFDIRLASEDPSQEGKLVYTSDYIPVGAELRNLELQEPLPKGDYDAVLTYYLVDENNQPIVDAGGNPSSVSVAIKLHIQN